ncbi:pilus assembly protein PilM [Erwinia sp. HDF1-3R]|uniref:type IV pilus biogenesis protein PilM n=1 Tax=Erwinia sp. HDF1-3R TaxID=3141543 RepID=UPI0031F59677
MAFQTWQVGLDIQNGQLCALGIQRRRNGWQLRHWWQHALPQDTLTHGLLQRPQAVIALLQRWRRQLPYHISLRVGFPPQLVLQRHIDLPPVQLREPERSSYITAAASRFFPIELEKLALDYRQPTGSASQFCVTAARREALQNWLDCLEQARLTPQVMELSPSALFALSQTLSLDPAVTLIHRLADHWLWFAPQRAGQRWGWCSREEANDFSALRTRHFAQEAAFYYSTVEQDALPDGAKWLNPLDAIPLKQAPLPVYPGAFSLAAGLALRPEDS